MMGACFDTTAMQLTARGISRKAARSRISFPPEQRFFRISNSSEPSEIAPKRMLKTTSIFVTSDAVPGMVK